MVTCVETANMATGFVDSEFIAEEFYIEIQPNFNMAEPIRLISHECGPFSRRTTCRVPLWLGLYLERRGKCQILTPSWLSVPYLLSKLRAERERGTGNFASLNDESIQVAISLLHRDYLVGEYLGGQNIRNQIESLITELMMLRRGKAVEGLKQIDVSTSVVEISNMTSAERASIRGQCTSIMGSLSSLWKIRDSVIGLEPRGT